MFRFRNTFNYLLAPALLAASTAASAHTGAGAHLHAGDGAMQALMAGLSHPIAGLDHLLAMLALGLWCGLMLKRQWLPPVAFAACMALGLALTQTPLELPAVEPMVAASLLAFGLLLVAQRRLPVALAMVLAGAFALFHGYAHGEVFPHALPAAVFWAYMAGMVATTLVLHALGVALGRAMRGGTASAWAARLAGVAAMGYGAVALAG
ncbi:MULTISPECIES: HupE/UreJ family protein [Delftia]|uniref:HupE/UreJ family protein n=1 Tax=Delftia lacustris TaxID=558537 RepID=A0A7T2YN96_9BURK|nr:MULTISPECIES: HupE/UreJ family protein [Delftia]KAA9175599.1 HupE/UreJ family protein [Delftia sp. BR1]EPD44018.1 urease accessory protein [Delftia acidovorans CCUG 15835]MDR6727663.1 urease accessory protein [Delftia lacustris]QPS79036.1 HupE/UreJ family protein [Delftia lacustris]WEL99271.1 HupE/UreJ family protein [Delftia tsuruhatensis]